MPAVKSATALAAVKSGGDFLELVKSSAHILFTVQFADRENAIIYTSDLWKNEAHLLIDIGNSC